MKKKIIHTTKQLLARDRNWFKFQLLGLHFNIDQKHLGIEEKLLLKELHTIKQVLLDRFEEYSRCLGLKVPHVRCWCGKEGKYNAEYETWHDDKLVCKKHIKEE